MKRITLSVIVYDDSDTAIITDALGETMRMLESNEWDRCSFFEDPDDPARADWVIEIGEQ